MHRNSVKIFLFAAALALLCTACSKKQEAGKQLPAGRWVLLNEKGEDTPITVKFDEDGTLSFRYDNSLSDDEEAAASYMDQLLESMGVLDIAEQCGITELLKSGTVSGVADKLSDILKLQYEVKNDQELKLTLSILFGSLNHDWTVKYALDGDSLIFDDVKYRRLD